MHVDGHGVPILKQNAPTTEARSPNGIDQSNDPTKGQVAPDMSKSHGLLRAALAFTMGKPSPDSCRTRAQFAAPQFKSYKFY